MEQNIRKFLQDQYPRLIREITGPVLIANLIDVLTPNDKEIVKSETRERGNVAGVMELLNILQKRGNKAFPMFLRALRELDHTELANDLQSNAPNGNGPAIARGPWTLDPTNEHVPESPDQKVIVSTGSHQETINPHQTTENHSPNRNPPSANDVKQEPAHSSGPAVNCMNKKKKHLGQETLLKDVSLNLKDKIVSMLNPEAALNKNWQGLAGEAGLTVSETDEMRSSYGSSPMDQLYQWMVHREYRVIRLVEFLQKMERHDVISEITEAGYYRLANEHAGQHLIDQEQAASSSPAKVSLPSPTQESACSALATMHNKDKKECRLSHEVEDGKDDEYTESDKLVDMLPEEDEVFIPETIEGRALVIDCEKYKCLTNITKLNQEVKQLYDIVEQFEWEEIRRKNGTSTQMREEVLRYSKAVNNNTICFVYLAGQTRQINGENYLMPTDVELESCTADIIECSLNMNRLIRQLSGEAMMVIVFIDGAHYDEAVFESQYVLPGLAPIIPPANTVISFPCQPGYTRQPEESLLYVKALTKILRDEPSLTPSTLFAKLKEELKGNKSAPTEFSLARSLLPISLNTSELDTDQEASRFTIEKPAISAPRHAIIFSNMTPSCMIFPDRPKITERDTQHLEASLKQLGWQVKVYKNKEIENIKIIVRKTLKEIKAGGNRETVMLYFFGYQTNKDSHSFGGDELPCSGIAVSWLVNIMGEYVLGPKVVIVDDPSPFAKKINAVTPLPQEFLLSLPKEKNVPTKDSYTLLLSQNLAAAPEDLLRNIIKTTATKWKYQHVTTNPLFST